MEQDHPLIDIKSTVLSIPKLHQIKSSKRYFLCQKASKDVLTELN